MKAQVIIGTRAGSAIGKVVDITQEEVDQLKNGLKELMSEKLNYMELETDRGWTIVPGANVQFVEIALEEN